MAIQMSTTLRSARINAIESTVGTSPKLQIRTGAPPATCAAADTGTLLVELTLPSDWENAASNGVSTLNGTWTGTGVAAGSVGHFRLKDSAGTTCHMQGTCANGSGDLPANSATIAIGQTVNITLWTQTDGNA